MAITKGNNLQWRLTMYVKENFKQEVREFHTTLKSAVLSAKAHYDDWKNFKFVYAVIEEQSRNLVYIMKQDKILWKQILGVKESEQLITSFNRVLTEELGIKYLFAYDVTLFDAYGALCIENPFTEHVTTLGEIYLEDGTVIPPSERPMALNALMDLIYQLFQACGGLPIQQIILTTKYLKSGKGGRFFITQDSEMYTVDGSYMIKMM